MRKLGFISCLLLAISLTLPLQAATAAPAGKLVVIVMENETYGNIVGNSEAPYLNQLIGQGELFTDYAGVASGSNPNYLAMTSGVQPVPAPPAPNIFQAIDGSGTHTWKEFMESMPGNCGSGNRPLVPGTTVPLYTSDHDPDYKYSQYQTNSTCSTNDVPMTTSTFNPASLPDLSYIVPNECDDMHTLPASGQACPAYFGQNSGTSLINMGDNWLATVVPTLLAQPNVTVLITWDEGVGTTTPSQHVVTLEAGAGVTAGSHDGNFYTHYNLEATLYCYLSLGPVPGNGAGKTPLPIPNPAGACPVVASVKPGSGPPGVTVTIDGKAFTGATSVTFNGVAADFTVNSDIELTATVPNGASSGPIVVQTPAGTGTSAGSFTVTGGTPPPAAPANLTAQPSGSTVNLSWTDSDPTVSYQLDRSNDPGFGTYASVSLPAGTTSYKDTGLAAAAYYYRLAAVNSGGQSPYASASAATISYAALVAGRAGELAHWRLGEGSGTAAADSVGSYNGAYVNGPGLGSPGAITNDPDTSVTFNGTNQRVTLPSLPAAGDFTIEGWTYLTNGSVNNNTLYGGNGTVRLLARPGTGPTAAYAGVTLNGTEYVLQPLNPVPNLNTWVYWVLTRQGSTLTLYRDGVQIGQRTDLPATATANISGYIASQSNSLYYLNGRVDDVAVYSRALSSADVSNGYVAAVNGIAPASPGSTASYASLVTAGPALLAYWRLGEAAGTPAADATGSYNGAYVNGPGLGSPGAITNDPDTSVTFNGTNQRVTLPSLPAAGDFTIEGWTYLTNGSVNNNTLYGGNGTVRLLARPGTGPTAAYAGVTLNGTEYVLQPLNPVPNLNTWVYWVLTRQGSTLTLYRDGVQIGQRTDLPATATANISGYIASQSNSLYYLNGRVDDVAIYASALTPATVASHYQAALNGPAPS